MTSQLSIVALVWAHHDQPVAEWRGLIFVSGQGQGQGHGRVSKDSDRSFETRWRDPRPDGSPCSTTPRPNTSWRVNCVSRATRRCSARNYTGAVTEWDDGLLGEIGREFVELHLEEPELVADMSWGQVDTTVLRVRACQDDFVVKAAGLGNHHIGREITAHESFTAPLVRIGRTGRLVAADRTRNILITSFQQGDLVEGTSHELDFDLHVQAGAILRAFHDQNARVGIDYERRATEKALAALDRQHRIDPRAESEARRLLAGYEPKPVTLVPTHGDWQPRNWLVHERQVRVIDFGRFDYRPAATDLCRLAVQQWAASSTLEAAFLEGYGSDPRDTDVWRMDLLREAIGTAVWAFGVGDEAFESQGHELLAQAILRY
ncbi:MAG: phosphotransferase family protein [Actinomycetota bacterium]